MPGKFLNYPFDEEIFLMNWQAAQDPVRTALFDSGAVVKDEEIARLIANGSAIYTLPFYKVLGGTEDNYDGTNNITVTAPDGGSQSGVVYGRAHAWKDQDFVHDFGNGINPTIQISQQVAKYWQKRRQNRLVGILKAIFAITDDSTDAWDEWQKHTLSLALTTAGTVSDDNRVGAASAGAATQKAVGDNSGIFKLAVMHSAVAQKLNEQQLLNFRKYTDPAGIARQLNIADWNGYTVVVDDGVPHEANDTTHAVDYTTYLLGDGAIRFASAPVKNAVELGRDRLANGGYDYIVTRLRETIHPNGFTFTMPSSTLSPTDQQLGTAANWSLAGLDPKGIAIARIISNV